MVELLTRRSLLKASGGLLALGKHDTPDRLGLNCLLDPNEAVCAPHA